MKNGILALLCFFASFALGVALLRQGSEAFSRYEARNQPSAPSLHAGVRIDAETANDAAVPEAESAETAESEETQSVLTPEAPSFDKRFRLPVLQDGALVSMSLHDYVLGAVLGEIPGSFHPEAQKAQAVACRTYALRQYRYRKHGAAAVCTDPGCCMNWVDPAAYAEEYGDGALAAAEAAVSGTDGMALYYDGAPIIATFFSCSGGRTENACDVWEGEVPYLRAVDSPDEDAPYDTDVKSVPLDSFVSVLSDANEMAQFPNSRADWIGPFTYTEGGGVETAELGGCIYTGTQLRRLFGLRSTLFSLALTEDAAVFTTHGYGHRVGLSQYGAEAMANRGCDWKEILRWYYPGAEAESAAQQ